MEIVKLFAFAAGLILVVGTLGSAIRTVILPRAIPARISRWVFFTVRQLLRLRTGRNASFARRDRVLAVYGPLSLLTVLLAWLLLVGAGFTAMYWGLGRLSVREAFVLSGVSVTTLGSFSPPDLPTEVLTVAEATIGLVLLALLITYLPSIYSAFSRRENAVTALEVRAGSPPSGAEMIWRFSALEQTDRLRQVWEQWENWFVDLEETHTTFPALVFFRSPQPDHSWVTAAGAVLDGAALVSSAIDIPREVQAQMTIRAGYLALRRIADFFSLPYPADPAPDDRISVTREEFDEALDRLAEADVPCNADRDQAWRDFAGWRVNYDAVLLELAVLVEAPAAPWSADRIEGRKRQRIPLLRLKQRPPRGA